jgi:hypothetical protein
MTADLSPYQAKSLRGLRGIGAAVLTLEALVVALAIPVVLDTGHGGHTLRHITVAAATVVAVLLIVAGAELRRPWGTGFATGVQVLAVLVSVAAWTFLFLTVLFAAIWVGWLFMLRSLLLTFAGQRADNRDGQQSV